MKLGVLMLLATTTLAADEGKPKAVPYDTHDGYFVSNQFEPTQAASFLAIQNERQFKEIFGDAVVMKDKSHRLPKNAFQTKLIVAAIHRDRAVWTYDVKTVELEASTLVVRYATTKKSSDTAEFASPLIISVSKGDYAAVEFVENGKSVKTLDLRQALKIQSDDRSMISVESTPNRCCIRIDCQRGIGAATVECPDNAWPDVVVIRIYLRGLESFSISSEQGKLISSVLSHGDHQQLQHLSRAGSDAAAVSPGDAAWMPIRMFDATGKEIRRLPEANGFFELTVPKPLIASSRRIDLSWIDFYR